MKVVVLGYQDCIGSVFLGPYDMLTMCLRLLGKPGRSLPFEVVTREPGWRCFKGWKQKAVGGGQGPGIN